jgi:hypothetical protein
MAAVIALVVGPVFALRLFAFGLLLPRLVRHAALRPGDLEVTEILINGCLQELCTRFVRAVEPGFVSEFEPDPPVLQPAHGTFDLGIRAKVEFDAIPELRL